VFVPLDPEETRLLHQLSERATSLSTVEAKVQEEKKSLENQEMKLLELVQSRFVAALRGLEEAKKKAQAQVRKEISILHAKLDDQLKTIHEIKISSQKTEEDCTATLQLSKLTEMVARKKAIVGAVNAALSVEFFTEPVVTADVKLEFSSSLTPLLEGKELVTIQSKQRESKMSRFGPPRLAWDRKLCAPTCKFKSDVRVEIGVGTAMISEPLQSGKKYYIEVEVHTPSVFSWFGFIEGDVASNLLAFDFKKAGGVLYQGRAMRNDGQIFKQGSTHQGRVPGVSIVSGSRVGFKVDTTLRSCNIIFDGADLGQAFAGLESPLYFAVSNYTEVGEYSLLEFITRIV